jgi:SOS-response transcriptional repressor LexA
MPSPLPNHFKSVSITSGSIAAIEVNPNTTISAELVASSLLGKNIMAQTKNEHLNNINHHLKQLKADGYKSRQAVELLVNQNERNQLALIHRLEAAVFDALHDGVSDDDIAATDPTVENILRDVEESLVH